ncbi:MAG: peptidase M14 [Chloracidobacterium sp.]|nr:peptidase M14 [Chloracidobacterium sp.]
MSFAQTPKELAEMWEKEHISKYFPSDVWHKDLLIYLDDLRKLGLKVDEVGRSNAERSIYQVGFGRGPLKIFMWSQMHGDEPTATSALVDMLSYFQKHRQEDWVKKIEETVTIRAVPMLNPDGAEAYQRRNLQGIDVNRDAADLRTPEARLLKKLRDDWSPAIGFNLHNQQALTTVGRTPKQAAISLLVVFGDEAKTVNEGQARNQRVAAAMATALQQLIPGHIGRYDDEWAPTAFGDNFSAWGTPVILIETGALHGRDEMFLVKMNFVAFVTAIQSIVTGSEKTQDPAAYISLPSNGSGGIVNYLFRRANIIDHGDRTVGDIAVIAERRRASFVVSAKISAVGALGTLHGLDEYDASGFNVYQRFGKVRPVNLANFIFIRQIELLIGIVVIWFSNFRPMLSFQPADLSKARSLYLKSSD